MSSQPVLTLDGVRKVFKGAGGREVVAVNEVSLQVGPGSSHAIVGESGSGKSTLARLSIGLLRPDAGTVCIAGNGVASMSAKQLRALRAKASIVFQEPLQALNPVMSIGRNVEEPLRIHQRELSATARRDRASTTLSAVGLHPRLYERDPASLSGGQQQRVSIARAIVLEPRLLVLDEPTSSLDVSVRAQIWDLLSALRRDTGIALLLVTHDFESVEALCDTASVMGSGRVVDQGSVDTIVRHPESVESRALAESRISLEEVAPTPATCNCLRCRPVREDKA